MHLSYALDGVGSTGFSHIPSQAVLLCGVPSQAPRPLPDHAAPAYAAPCPNQSTYWAPSPRPCTTDGRIPCTAAAVPSAPLVCYWSLAHCDAQCRTLGISWQQWGIRPKRMNFGEWMAVKMPPEQEFELEAQCRKLQAAPAAGPLAAALLRQTAYQQLLLQQAVNEIARLELELMQY
jgi:hypothetical protein